MATQDKYTLPIQFTFDTKTINKARAICGLDVLSDEQVKEKYTNQQLQIVDVSEEMEASETLQFCLVLVALLEEKQS